MFISTLTERQLSPQLTCLDIENAHATASISLLGGQVLSFKPKHDGRERLFISDAAKWDGSKPIRGGIPVCWPWFGAHKENAAYPAHGFVRTRRWKLAAHEDLDDCTRLVLEVPDTAHPGFAGAATLTLEVLVGRELSISMRTCNTGNSGCRLTMALHTYFSVNDVRDCTLEGLNGTYSDKTRDWAMLQTPAAYRFTEETDRIHLHAAPEVDIVGQHCVTRVQSRGHDSIVVWNPWATGVGAFADMSSNGWTSMLCVETASTQGLTLEPGQTHVMTQVVG